MELLIFIALIIGYIEDLNWENCSAIVNGKGSKQREVYFTIECKVWLKKYLASREDSCKALFVTDTHGQQKDLK
ncbi:site-specific recombinase XerC [Paenibacillus sp. BK720]|nr:site-specific recombinase XerC [Paenibacillus sp. BK720]